MKSFHERRASAPAGVVVWPVSIFVVALAVRLVHLFQILPAPFFPFKMGDAASYDAWAQQIAAGNWLGNEVFYQAPLYPYFLGVVHAVAGDDMFSIRACQALVGAASCVLLAGAGWRIFSKRVGILSGFVLATYAPAVFFDSLVQKSVLDGFFLCLTLFVTGGLLQQRTNRRWCALGAAIGCFVLCRENGLLLVPAVLLWIPFDDDSPGRRKWKSAGWFLCGVTVVLMPVALRNLAVGGEFHLTTSQFGPNFYIGNNAQSNGSYRPLRPHRGSAKYERRDARELAEKAVGRSLSPAEISRYWTDQALRFVRDEPGKWLKLMLRKFVLTWNAVELVDTEDQYTYAEWSWPLWLGGFVLHFGVLTPLALFGIWCTWQQRRRLLLLYLILGFYMCGVVLFYVVGRYRYPLVPPLILLATAGIFEARSFFRQAPTWKVAGALTSSLIVAVFCNYPMASADTMRATTHYNVGVELDALHQYEAAIEQYKLATRLDPNHRTVQNNIGCSYLNLGQLDRAVEHLKRALSQDPEFAEAIYNLGATYLAKNEWNRAKACFDRLVQLRPEMVRAHLGQGVTAGKLGDRVEAEKAFRRALAIDPEFQDAQKELERITATEPAKD